MDPSGTSFKLLSLALCFAVLVGSRPSSSLLAPSHHGLSTPVKVGLGVGIPVGVILLGLVVIMHCRRSTSGANLNLNASGSAATDPLAGSHGAYLRVSCAALADTVTVSVAPLL